MLHIEHQFNMLYKNYFENREIDELYVSVALKSLATSLIQIFIPIFLYKLGYSISQIALYYIVYYIAVILVQPLGMSLNSRFGPKAVLTLGTAVLALYYFLLKFIEVGSVNYLLVGMVCGISVSLYYSAFHIVFSQNSLTHREAREYSMVEVFINIATTLGPILGAFFISELSFNAVFAVISVLLTLSTIPLFFTKDVKVVPRTLPLRKLFKADTPKKALVYITHGMLTIASNIFWPLFIYLTLNSVFSLGFIVSLTSFLVVLLTMLFGWYADKHKQKLYTFGIYTHSLSWVIRLFVFTPLGVTLSNMYAVVTNLAIELPLSKIVYEDSKKAEDIESYFIFREVTLDLGRIAILLVALVTGEIYWVFVLAFFVSFFYLFLFKSEKNQPLY